jgi:hypothetical protein
MEYDGAPEFLPAQLGKHLSVLRLYLMNVATKSKNRSHSRYL